MADLHPLDAGRLNRRVAYQTATYAAGPLGNRKATWSTVATYWAEVRTPKGQEVQNASQTKAVLTHVLVLRWPGFFPDPKGRFVEGSSVFNVTGAVDPDGRRRQLTVYASHDPAEAP